MGRDFKNFKSRPSEVVNREAILNAKRQAIVEDYILRGVSDESQIAAALGVPVSKIGYYLKKIRERWRQSAFSELDDKRHLRVNQMMDVAKKALNSFEVSKRDAAEYTVQEKCCTNCSGSGKDPKKKTEVIPCEACNGSGLEEDTPGVYTRCEVCDGKKETSQGPPCQECQGIGRIRMETTKRKGQAGDPAFLQVAKSCIESAAKFEGLAPPSTKMSRSIATQTHTIGGEIHQIVEEKLLIEESMPEDLILKARATIDLIEQCQRDQALRQEKKTLHVEHKSQKVQADEPPESAEGE